jgi:EAL domain-containing protein (putative c-di-GMP-specific phosphodiesterase class I)
VAEQTGFIVDLGQWVLREACRQMAAWLAEFSEASQLTVSVNLSAEQLGEDLLPLVERTLRESGLGPERLRLEITESAVLNNSEAASRALAMLRLYGVGLSLDDFGTGYASFSYLHQLPIDTLKIDRTFIARLGSSDGSDETGETDIVAAMINLAHTLKLDVVAEGVETVLQAEMLQSMGCDEGQGYLFARPMPPEQGSALIASSPRW